MKIKFTIELPTDQLYAIHARTGDGSRKATREEVKSLVECLIDADLASIQSEYYDSPEYAARKAKVSR